LDIITSYIDLGVPAGDERGDADFVANGDKVEDVVLSTRGGLNSGIDDGGTYSDKGIPETLSLLLLGDIIIGIDRNI